MSIANVITVARQQIGKPYVFGSAGPNSFDCSGLVVYSAWHGDRKRLPHFTGTLVGMGTAVSKAQLQPGDLVFPDAGHVQIYTGAGMVIEAPHSGAVVREVPIRNVWRAKRVFGGVAASPGPAGSGNGVIGVDNPLIPDSVEKMAAFISDPATWRKAAYYTGGSILIIGGVVLMVSSTPVGKVVKAAI